MIRFSLLLFSFLLCIGVKAQTIAPASIGELETQSDSILIAARFQSKTSTITVITLNDISKPRKNRGSIFRNSTTFNKTRFYSIAGINLAVLGGSYLYMNNTWWSGQKTNFHFDGGTGLKHMFTLGRDAKYAKNLDKFGHFFGGIIIGDLFSQAVRWTGRSENSANIWGGVFGSAFECFIEVKDGFSPDWGFSMYDFISGTIGSFYPFFQSKSKFLRALDFKFSYWRINDYYFKTVKRSESFADDYMNQTYWLTFNIKRFKPQSKWPKWLGVSLGVGVDNKLNNYYTGVATNYDSGKGGYEFFIAPDIDFTGLLPKRPTWQRIAKMMNYIKFPAPTLRLSKNSKFFLLYF